MLGRSFNTPIGISYKWCSFCKHCIRSYDDKGKWLCAADTKTYCTDKIHPESGELNVSCMNELWEFDTEKFKGHRW